MASLAKTLLIAGGCVGVVSLASLSTAQYFVGQVDMLYLVMLFNAGVLIGTLALTLIAAGGVLGVVATITGAAMALFKRKD